MTEWNTSHYGFKIKGLKLNNFRLFSYLELNFNDELTAFIGENGSGKSTILDAIAELLKYLLSSTFLKKKAIKSNIASNSVKHGTEASLIYLDIELSYPEKLQNFQEDENYDENYESWAQRVETVQIGLGINRISGKIRFIHDEKLEKFKKEIKYFRESFDALPILIYYGCNQLSSNVLDSQQVNHKYFSSTQRVYQNSLSPERFNFASFYQWFDHEWRISMQTNEKSKLLQDTIDKICFLLNDDINHPTYRNLKMDYQRTGDSMKIEVFREGYWNADEVNLMSSGQKAIIALGADIIRRLIEANPNLENPFEGNGIVLIDEIDLHLHPKWQRIIAPKLQEIFPNVQFVITTHSPFVVQSISAVNRTILSNSQTFLLKRDDELTYETIVNDYFDIEKLFDDDSESLLDSLQEFKQRILISEITMMDNDFLELLEKISTKGDEIKVLAARELRYIKKKLMENGKNKP